MHSRSFPTGQATTAMFKALERALAAERGLPIADAWLRSIRMTRGDLDDETRVVPLLALHRALVAFVQVAAREEIQRVSKHLVAADNLGVWVRVLRGTTGPGDAFQRLDSADSEYGRTTRWETTAIRPGWWHGVVRIMHDPALEQDGLLRLARLAELAAVPALFGWRDVRAVPREPATQSATVLVQEFEVRWGTPHPARNAVTGAVAGLAAGSVPLLAHVGSLGVGVVTVVGAGIAGALSGIQYARERRRQAMGHAQALRVKVLERGLSLNEAREREMGGQLEGMTIAAGQYRILRRMGSGATGVIYESVRISDGVPVAIKLLRAAAAHEAVASDRLRREAEALGLALHPNVVEVIDHGHLADGTAYLVMELLHGESLASWLRGKGRLAPRELLPIAMQICDALSAVHAAGVVHRDVKPSNIFLSVDGENSTAPPRVKLLDFGIARVEWEEMRITNTGGPLGTPGYMSPEQETGSSEIDARSDIFALGAVLYECLVGEPPPPRSPSGLVPMGEKTAIRFDSGTQKSAALVPLAWRATIEKAMALHPSERFQNARELGNSLRGADQDIATAATNGT